MYKYFNYCVHLIYPPVCSCCNVPIKTYRIPLCKECYGRMAMSIADSEIYHMTMDKIFEERHNVCINNRVRTYIIFDNLLTQTILHRLKYGSDKKLAFFMGYLYARYLYKTSPEYLQDIDTIIPVPISKRKLKERGYNQSEIIAKGITKVFSNITINTDIVLKTKNIESQAKQKYKDRFINIIDAFTVNKSISCLKDKHVLLVDEVFTTGSTLAYIIKRMLEKLPNLKISVAVLAYRPASFI